MSSRPRRPDSPELAALRAAAAEHGLPLARGTASPRHLGVVRKGGPTMGFDSALEVAWTIAGDQKTIAAFLGGAAGVLTNYLTSRASRTVKIKVGDIEVELKGTSDIDKAQEIVAALQHTRVQQDREQPQSKC